MNNANPQRTLATDVRLILSSEVAKLARTFYREAGPIQAAAATDTDIIHLTAVSSDPQKTDRTVTVYMRAFIEFKRVSQLDDVNAAQQLLTKRINNLTGQIQALDVQIARATEPARSNLQSQRSNYTGQQDLARQQIERLQEGITFEDPTWILAKPFVPTEPFSPKPRKAATQAAGVGLVLGIGLAFLRDILDDSIKSREDLAQAAGKLSVLGLSRPCRQNCKKTNSCRSRVPT